jgi:protein TonB
MTFNPMHPGILRLSEAMKNGQWLEVSLDLDMIWYIIPLTPFEYRLGRLRGEMLMSTLPYAIRRDGFLARRKASPIGLGGAVIFHAVAVAALVLIPAKVIIPDVYETLTTYAIPPDPPPPERKPQPPKPEKIVQKSQIDAPDTIVPLPNSTAFTLPKSEPIIPTWDTGPTRIEPQIITPPHKPLFLDSRMDPRYARNLQPDYPPARLREDEEGKVIVRVRIGAEGRVLSIEQVSASHPDFWRATREQALKAWRFLPATRDGVPVESQRVMTVYFNMQSQ